jgi:hypothetical protein
MNASGHVRGRPRAMLVGITKPLLSLLEGSLADGAEVTCVPFPSPLFDHTVEEIRPDLVVVDVAFLDERTVRPALIDRLAPLQPVLVFTTATGYGWVDDLRRGRSYHLDHLSADSLLALVDRPALSVVRT